MSLFIYKGSIAAIIVLVTLVVGFASLHFIQHCQHFLTIGDAFADGIFLGAAAFHLVPEALQGIPVILVILTASVGFFLLFILERWIIHREKKRQTVVHDHICTVSSSMLVGILFVHAFIAGAALGISDTMSNVSVLLIAILAHKGFESFALMMGLRRSMKNETQIKGILWAFTFVTPLGIILAALVQAFFQTQIANLTTSFFSAFAAGSFLYIGTLPVGHNHFHSQRGASMKSYEKILTAFIGIVAMGIVTIWA